MVDLIEAFEQAKRRESWESEMKEIIKQTEPPYCLACHFRHEGTCGKRGWDQPFDCGTGV